MLVELTSNACLRLGRSIGPARTVAAKRDSSVAGKKNMTATVIYDRNACQ